MVRGIGRRPCTQAVWTARTIGSLPAGIAGDLTHSAPQAAGHYRDDVCPVEIQFLVPHNLRGTILKELGHGFWTLRAASSHPFDEVGRARARALGHGVTLAPDGREIDIFDGSSGVCVSWHLSENASLAAAPLAQSLFSRLGERRATEGRCRHAMAVGALVPPDATLASQQCTRMAQNGSERPFSPICVHSCVPTAACATGRGYGSHDNNDPMAPVTPGRSDLRPTPPGR